MIGIIDRGPGGYDFRTKLGRSLTELPEDVQHKPIFQTETWKISSKFHPDTFVTSNGRQFAQALSMLAGVAKLEEHGIILDLDVLNAPDARYAIRSRLLPKGHTPRPKEAQVKGVYEFWWLQLRDAAQWRYDPNFKLLADEDAIADRFRECEVKPWRTSSTSLEEISGINSSLRYIREHDETRAFSSRQLLELDIGFQLRSSTWWQANNEPRADGGDRHAFRWRDALIEAPYIPENKRSLYNHLGLDYITVLDKLVAMSPDELASQPEPHGRWYKEHTELVMDYNENHPKPKDKIIAMHRPNHFYKSIAPEVITKNTDLEHIRRLGALSLAAA